MLKLLAVATALAMCLTAHAAEFMETFSYPDASFPADWTWTGDPRGGAEFLVYGGEFRHVEGSHVHYFRHTDVCGSGIYEFDVLDSHWTYAWRITPEDPNQGRAFILEHRAYPSMGYYFYEFSWVTDTAYPDAQYWYVNGGGAIDEVFVASPDSVGWRHVTIVDDETLVTVHIDGELLFEEIVEPIPTGFVGLGSTTRAGTMTPAFDNVAYSFGASPVDVRRWGSIKALFR